MLSHSHMTYISLDYFISHDSSHDYDYYYITVQLPTLTYAVWLTDCLLMLRILIHAVQIDI
jgi:hypothetical protein